MRPTQLPSDADLSALARLHALCFADGWTEQALRDLLKTSGTTAFVAPGGFVLVRVAGDEAEILTIAVAPDTRRNGIGAALLGEAGRHAHEQGARTLVLEAGVSNAAAQALYARFGFRKVGARKSYYADSQDAHILRADLPFGKTPGFD